MKYFSISVWLFLLFFISCTGQQQKATPIEEKEAPKSFSLPDIPTILHSPEAKAEYIGEHYWDNFDFADTAYIHLPDIMEQAIVNFMHLMLRVPQEVAENSISNLYTKATPYPVMLRYFWETMSRYWNNATSPMKNEEMFITLCQLIEKHPKVEEALKQRAIHAGKLAAKNRVGQFATDFLYTLSSGKQGRLSQIKADYTLVFFYDPDCDICTESKNQMKQSLILNQMLQSGMLKILTVYPDEDIALWRNRLVDMSGKWINAYDKEQVLARDLLYDLSSIPSFYLLDKEKKVLLKDADWNQVMEFLEIYLYTSTSI